MSRPKRAQLSPEPSVEGLEQAEIIAQRERAERRFKSLTGALNCARASVLEATDHLHMDNEQEAHILAGTAIRFLLQFRSILREGAP